MNKKLLFLILILSILNIQAQYLPLRIYTSADGLASNHIRYIVNDNNGALWIGCGSGLSYFTGFKFVNYGLKEGLPDITVLKIENTQHGDTFILTYHGIAYKKAREDYFKKIPINGEIVDFIIVNDNKTNPTIFACIKNKGIFYYSDKKKQTQPWWTKDISPYSITAYNKNILVSFENGQIFLINTATKNHIKIATLPLPAKLKKIDKNSFLAITKKEIFTITKQKEGYSIKKLYSSTDSTLVIFDAIYSKENILWIGTNKYLIKHSKKNIKFYTTDNGLPELPVFSVFENNDGILWIGTNSGLAKLMNNDMVIYKKVENRDIESCISLFWDNSKKQIWAGINRGVSIIKKHQTLKYDIDYLNQFIIWDIEKDPYGNYYFATEGGGVLKVSSSGKKELFKKENGCLPDNRVTDLLYLNNTLYVATKEGFALQKNNKWQVYTTKNGLPASYVRNLTHDEKGNIYLSIYGSGIVLFKNNTFIPAIKNLKNEYSTIYAVKYKNGILWAACNYGLVKVKNGFAKLYDSKYGFPNYSGVAILPLKDYVWVGTDGGACLFDIKKEKVIEILTKDEGLPGNEFTTHNAICKDSNDNVWIGVFGGIARINQKTILNKRKLFNPKIKLKNITYTLKKHIWKIHPMVNNIEIPYGAKDITFNFDVIWFRNDYSTAIFYKLKGENENWKRIETLKNTKVYFNFLTYGKYTLYLKIVNLSGSNQSIEKKIISITIPTPWWASEFFILAIILLVLIVGGLLFTFLTYKKTQKLQEEKESLNKLIEEKTNQLKKANEILREKNKMLAELAERDFLTGLYNRRHAIKVLKLYQKLAERDPDFKISFILIDIDFFKLINDTYGHDAGDFVLKQLSLILQLNTRKSDIVARWGGEEFLVILPKTNIEQAKVVAEKLRKTIEKTEFEYNGNKIKLTISAGVAEIDLSYSQSEKALENILSQVDEKLYQAKQQGRNLIIY